MTAHQKGSTMRPHPKTPAWIERRMRQGDTLAGAAGALDRGDLEAAIQCCRDGLISRPEEIRFPVSRVASRSTGQRKDRKVSPGLRMQIAHRDGFIDRYSPERWRLVNPAVIRIIGLAVGPEALPTVLSDGTPRAPNVNSQVWWDAWPAIDHRLPHSRGGPDDPDNLICVSWWRNETKGALTTQETGWEVQPPGNLSDWDGLSSWMIGIVAHKPALLDDRMVATYYRATAPLYQCTTG
jgi:hypothetical protein